MPNDQAEPADTGEPRVPLRLFALKHGDTFLVADAFGDVLGDGDGLFRDDTRVLSPFVCWHDPIWYQDRVGWREPAVP